MTRRVLVAEDSPIFAEALREAIEDSRDLEVCGVATDGREAVELCSQLAPDLVTMDVRMPVMDGLSAIEEIMSRRPTPILVMTADPRGETGELAVEALRRGALDLMQKPLDWPIPFDRAHALRERIRLLASVPVVHHMRPRTRAAPSRPSAPEHPVEIAAIGASTGGPPALARILGGLPSDYRVPIAIVQHISSGFAANLVRWLDGVTRLEVRLARDGDVLGPGLVLLAPDGRHMEVGRGGRVSLTNGPPVDGHRPSVTVLLESVARSFGARSAGLLLTGMGRDGAAGLQAIRRAGGATAAQDRDSSAVWGMPRAAVELGAAASQLPLDGCAPWLVRLAEAP